MTLTATDNLLTIDESIAVLNSSHLIATVDTRNSRYLLVKRSGYVSAMKVADLNGRSVIVHAMEPILGDDADVDDDGILRIWRANPIGVGYTLIFTSSAVVSAHIVEN